MSALLLDASVWVAAGAIEEPFHRDADTLVESTVELAALDLTLLEVANAIAVKRGEPGRARTLCGVIVARCQQGRLLRVGPELIEHGLGIAAEHGLTAYDAAYVAAACRNGWTLVSTDFRDLVSKGLAVAPDAAV